MSGAAKPPVKKKHVPAMSEPAYNTMLTRVISARQNHHLMIEELENRLPRWSKLIDDLRASKEAIEAVEERLVNGLRRDYPDAKAPHCTVF